ncbi:SH2 domain-containing adapter protein E isoform X2 [Mastacembelus armatus]|uniref:SH2 domain-containing adapter protein E n=1 Tax=Mastacembelus armatus TaxID=205130 RepID=A0A3Q3M5B8_9TELE|nr:SH2 domain-containing adapter protein E-like isoform X2 [Mastacembelus armatus]
MAKWFRDFPINLKNGNERVRSASESGPQSRAKPSFSRDSLKGNQRKDGGVGGLLAGRNRKNSATELGRNSAGSSGTVWESLTPGKGRKNSKIESSDENRQVRTSSLAQAYIDRMIKVDKQDKTPKTRQRNGISEQKPPDNEKGRSDIKTTLIILEDYADPFDAEKTKEQREAERAGVNDGYMEPYDAQVIITEVRRRGSKDLLKVCVLLDRGQRAGKGEEGKPTPPNIYDTPYEGGLDGDSEGVWIPVTRPESDIRPAGEYELPWEWRKEDIVRALSAQFEAVDCSPSKENGSTSARPQQQQQQQQQQHTLRQKNWNHKTLVSSCPSTSSSSSFPSSPILKLSPLTPPSPSFPTLKLSPLSPSSSPNKLSPPSPTSPGAPLDGETAKVDPSLPLEKQSWYHGSVSRQQAEAQLQRCREASFLVRDSESGTSKYSIALKTSQNCVHIIVAQTKSSKGLAYTLDQSSCVFSNIPELVQHYCTHRLPFTGAEHMTLQHPVPRPH